MKRGRQITNLQEALDTILAGHPLMCGSARLSTAKLMQYSLADLRDKINVGKLHQVNPFHNITEGEIAPILDVLKADRAAVLQDEIEDLWDGMNYS